LGKGGYTDDVIFDKPFRNRYIAGFSFWIKVFNEAVFMEFDDAKHHEHSFLPFVVLPNLSSWLYYHGC